MKTFLLLWNPDKWEWTSLESDIKNISLTGRSTQRWSCGVTKSIRPGDRVFLLRTGKEPRGIIGAGFAFTEPFYDKHWGDVTREALFIEADFDTLLDADIEPILTLDRLESELTGQNWHPQASGTSVLEGIIERLESMWFEFLPQKELAEDPQPLLDLKKDGIFFEGAPTEVRLTRYERNPYARKKCIEHHGYSCSVCGFNFGQRYGEFGDEYIHVHHIERIADKGKVYSVDPINDLIPVCANCHAIIHRRQKPLSISEVRALLK